jgi:hypothetical protein
MYLFMISPSFIKMINELSGPIFINITMRSFTDKTD